MVNPKRLIEFARKWQRMAAGKRKRISHPAKDMKIDFSSSSRVSKGHFVVYSTDHKRFLLPLNYLSNNVFRELFKMSEEEFGLPANGPIRLPCDAISLEYIVAMLRQNLPESLERALLMCVATSTCHSSATSSLGSAQSHNQTAICGF